MDWKNYQEKITIEDKDGKSFMEFFIKSSMEFRTKQ